MRRRTGTRREPLRGDRPRRAPRAWPLWLAVAMLAMPALGMAGPSPYIWDQDDDRVDDRLESVHLLGYAFSFEDLDTLGRQRIQVTRQDGGLLYGIYVVYERPLTNNDLTTLTSLGMPVLHRIEALPAVRSLATFIQIQAAAMLPGVDRIEATPVLHPLLRDHAASIGAHDPSERVFPTWSGTGGPSGEGVVVAILDTGVNDEAEGGYQGHEALQGRWVGGAHFVAGDSTLDTGRNQSVNPSDHGGTLTSAHGTHVAGTILGTGGPTGYARGIAPAARFVDVKVLNDAGVGTGLPEALDWCLHNAQRSWGGGHQGIQVVNLSLSSTDPSDGNDLASRLAAEAARRGIVVVASMGNDGRSAHVPSPAAGDGVIAVGALDAQRTPTSADDAFASFSNRGPRANDEDTDALDELKPDVLAPGVAVLSADGDLGTDGHQYRRLSGTSMSAAHVSGAAACLRSASPGASPAEIATWLRETAWRGLAGLPPSPPSADPRWHAARGYGAIDMYAARLEMQDDGISQPTRLELSGTGSIIEARLHTQREIGTAHFAIERASDVAGAPGAFAAYDSVPATGDGSLAALANRVVYPFTWDVPGHERGMAHWYRVAWTQDGVRRASPARRFVSPAGPSAATIEVSIVHNAYDGDVTGAVEVGSSGETPALVFQLPGSSAATASDWVTGTAANGNVEWRFEIEVPAGAANPWLPPSVGAPWWLRVQEGGFLNRSGRITSYRLIRHLESGDEVWTGAPTPLPTIEGQTVSAAIPGSWLGVEAGSDRQALRVAPNPVVSGRAVRFRISGATAAIEVFDLSGRRVARLPATPDAGGSQAVWLTNDSDGRALPGGVYVVRAAGSTRRVVVLAR